MRERPSSNKRRIVLWVAVGAAAALVLLLVGTRAIQRYAEARVVRFIEETTGIEVRLGTWSLNGLRGRLVVEDLELRNGAQSLLTARHVAARLNWRALIDRRLEFEDLTVRSPTLDLGAQWPQGPGPKGIAKPDFEWLQIRRLRIIDARLTAPALGAEQTSTTWSLAEGDVSGSLLNRSLRAEVNARLRVTGPLWLGEPVALRATIESALPAGPLLVSRFEAARKGVDLRGSAHWGFSQMVDSPNDRTVNLQGTLDLSALLVAPGSGATDGTLHADLGLDFQRQRVTGDLRISSLAGEWIEGLFGDQGLVSVQTLPVHLPGSRLDGRFRVANQISTPAATGLPPRLPTELAAGPAYQADLLWTRGGQVLARASALSELLADENSSSPSEADRIVQGPSGRSNEPSATRWFPHLLETSWDLHVEAQNVPGRQILAESAGHLPSFAPALLDNSTVLDLDLDARFRSAAPAREITVSQTKLVWRRGAVLLATAEVFDAVLPFDDGGGIDAARLAGRVDLHADSVPAEELSPWISERTLRDWGAVGTRFDIDLVADLAEIGRADATAVRGSARWTSDQGDLVLGRLAIRRDAGRGSQADQAAYEIDLDLEAPRQSIAEQPIAEQSVAARTATHAAIPDAADRVSARLFLTADLQTHSDSTIQAAINDGGQLLTRLIALSPGLAGQFEAEPEMRATLLNALRGGAIKLGVTMNGPLWRPTLDLDGSFRHPTGGGLAILGRVELAEQTTDLVVTAQTLDLTALELFEPSSAPSWIVEGEARLRGPWSDPLESLAATLHRGATAEDSPSPTAFDLQSLRIVADRSSGDQVRLRDLALSTPEFSLTGSGEFSYAAPDGGNLPPTVFMQRILRLPTAAHLELQSDRLPGAISSRAILELDTEHWTLSSSELSTPAGVGTLVLSGSRNGLQHLLEGRDPSSPEGSSRSPGFLPGTIEARLILPAADFQVSSVAPGPTTPSNATLPNATPTNLHFSGIDLEASLDFDNFANSKGILGIDRLQLTQQGSTIASNQRIVVELDEGTIRLPPSALLIDNEQVEVSGLVSLRRGWPLSPGGGSPIADLTLHAKGLVDVSWFNPFLLGGLAEGSAELAIDVSGPLDNLHGSGSLRGGDATLYYLHPYATRFDQLEIAVNLGGGRVTIEHARGRLNEGHFDLRGFGRLDGTDDSSAAALAELHFDLERVNYRLDYGLSAQLDANLDLELPAPGAQGELSGNINVLRGLVRRDIALEREVIDRLFAAPSGLDGPSELAERIRLDVAVTTESGVRVRNNVADLQAHWTELEVRGSLAEPLIAGRIEADPGASVLLYGQTVKLDQAALVLRALPGAEPEIEINATPSLRDRAFAQEGSTSIDAFDPMASSATSSAEGNLAQYLSERLLGALTAPLVKSAASSITIRPLLLLGESDPEARLLVARQIGRHLSVGVGFNLRGVEDRTYLLEASHLPALPRLTATVFTNEAGNEGGWIRQVFEIGRGNDARPQIGEINLRRREGAIADLPSGLLRSLSVRRGDLYSPGTSFDVSLELEETLRRGGYPDPHIEVDEARHDEFVDLHAEIDPGVRVQVTFQGDEPTTKQQRAIRQIFRADYYQLASLVEMRTATIEALRERGFLDPEVAVDLLDADDPRVRVVEIRGRGGRRIDVQEIRFPGIAEPQSGEIEAAIVARFATRGDRVSLAARDERADRVIQSLLARLGWTQARVIDRTLEEDGKTLNLLLDPGPRLFVNEIRLTGNQPSDAAHFESELARLKGEPARAARISEIVLRLENELREQGFLAARIVANLIPVAGNTPPDSPGSAADGASSVPRPDPAIAKEIEPAGVPAVLEILVEQGNKQNITDIAITGAQQSHEPWIEQISRLQIGTVPTPQRLSLARRELLATGLFDTVYSHPIVDSEGNTTVEVHLEERPRYAVSYGLRWEADEGLGVLADAVDRNALGRGIAVGLRALATEQRRSLRLYTTIPFLLGSDYDLDGFAEVRDLDLVTTSTATLEASLQLSRDFGRHGSGRLYGRFVDSRANTQSRVNSDKFSTPLLGLQYVHSRRSLTPGSRSFFSSIDLSGASTTLGSDFAFARLFAQLAEARPLLSTSRGPVTLAQSLRLGLIQNYGIPLARELRFLAGGAYSVRGYATESLGPRELVDGSLRALGGEALLIVNEELRFPLAGRFAGALFVDAGDVFAQTRDFEIDLRASFGLGLRFRSPVGILRFDAGFPVNRREGDPSAKFTFGLGEIF